MLLNNDSGDKETTPNSADVDHDMGQPQTASNRESAKGLEKELGGHEMPVDEAVRVEIKSIIGLYSLEDTDLDDLVAEVIREPGFVGFVSVLGSNLLPRHDQC